MRKGGSTPTGQNRTEEDNVFETPHKVPRELLERVSFHLVGKDAGGAIKESGMVANGGEVVGTWVH